MPEKVDDVGFFWEHRAGYERDWATPGHVFSCSYSYGRGAVRPPANPSVYTEGGELVEQGRIPSDTLVCYREVPAGVNLNRYAGDGSIYPMALR